LNVALSLQMDESADPITGEALTRKVIMKLAGIILIVIGVLALVYQGVTYKTTEKDAQLGPIEIQHQETHSIPFPPIVGGVCLVGGVIALGLGARGKM